MLPLEPEDIPDPVEPEDPELPAAPDGDEPIPEPAAPALLPLEPLEPLVDGALDEPMPARPASSVLWPQAPNARVAAMASAESAARFLNVVISIPLNND